MNFSADEARRKEDLRGGIKLVNLAEMLLTCRALVDAEVEDVPERGEFSAQAVAKQIVAEEEINAQPAVGLTAYADVGLEDIAAGRGHFVWVGAEKRGRDSLVDPPLLQAFFGCFRPTQLGPEVDLLERSTDDVAAVLAVTDEFVGEEGAVTHAGDDETGPPVVHRRVVRHAQCEIGAAAVKHGSAAGDDVMANEDVELVDGFGVDLVALPEGREDGGTGLVDDDEISEDEHGDSSGVFGFELAHEGERTADFVREPDVVLIAEADVRRGGGGSELDEVPLGVAGAGAVFKQMELAGKALCVFAEDGEGVVGGSVVAGEDVERDVLLGEDRVDLLAEEFLAVVGGKEDLDGWCHLALWGPAEIAAWSNRAASAR